MPEPPAIVNIAAHLPAMARAQPDALAVAYPRGRDESGERQYARLTFRELDRRSDHIARGLEAVGIGRGVRTALLVTPGGDFFPLVFALFKVGAVVVLVDPGIGRENLGRCLSEAEPEAFIGIPKAQAARVLLGWARATVKTTVTVGRRLFWGGHTLRGLEARGQGDEPYAVAATGRDETAAILFTSGSTGPPKGVVYSHGIFAAQVEMLRELYAIEPGEVDLPTFPLFALFDPALGMSAVIPDMDFTRPGSVDPAAILDPIRKFSVTSMFGSPALIDRVGRYGAAAGVKLPSLRRVISAGAPVAAVAIGRFTAMLPEGARLHTPYGATEALPVASIDGETILGETRARTEIGAGVCVGLPVPAMDVRVITVTDSPIEKWSDELSLPPWEVGEIVVRGPVVTAGYWGRPEATTLAKIPAGADFYHRMGDLGYLDATGRLWFCGRKSHRVKAPGGDLYTIPCEAIFNTHPSVRRSALVGVTASGGLMPVVCVELEPEAVGSAGTTLTSELRALAAAHPHTASIERFLVYQGSFPVDVRHNAKIFREKLAVWAARQPA